MYFDTDTVIKVASGIVGTILAVLVKHFLRREKPTGKMRYITATARYTHEMLSLIPGVKLTWHGIKCSSLSETRVAIWNGSRKLIERKDVAPASAIAWHPGWSRNILCATILQQTHGGIGAKAAVDHSSGRVMLDFDYLEPRDGFVISILHDGPEVPLMLEPVDSVQGSLKGFGALSRKMGNSFWRHQVNDYLRISPNASRFVNLAVLILPVLLLILSFGAAVRDLISEGYEPLDLLAGSAAIGFLISAYAMIVFALYRGKPPGGLTAYSATWQPVKGAPPDSLPFPSITPES